MDRRNYTTEHRDVLSIFAGEDLSSTTKAKSCHAVKIPIGIFPDQLSLKNFWVLGSYRFATPLLAQNLVHEVADNWIIVKASAPQPLKSPYQIFPSFDPNHI